MARLPPSEDGGQDYGRRVWRLEPWRAEGRGSSFEGFLFPFCSVSLLIPRVLVRRLFLFTPCSSECFPIQLTCGSSPSGISSLRRRNNRPTIIP
jgi:hypothetical protein